MSTYWEGNPITDCEICGGAITIFFVDGKTKSGPWGVMCLGCHKIHGVGLGTGKGQQYEKQMSGRWLKVA